MVPRRGSRAAAVEPAPHLRRPRRTRGCGGARPHEPARRTRALRGGLRPGPSRALVVHSRVEVSNYDTYVSQMGVRSIWTPTAAHTKGPVGSVTLPAKLQHTVTNARRKSAGADPPRRLRARKCCDADRRSVEASSKRLIALENPASKVVLTATHADGRRRQRRRTRDACFPHRGNENKYQLP